MSRYMNKRLYPKLRLLEYYRELQDEADAFFNDARTNGIFWSVYNSGHNPRDFTRTLVEKAILKRNDISDEDAYCTIPTHRMIHHARVSSQ